MLLKEYIKKVLEKDNAVIEIKKRYIEHFTNESWEKGYAYLFKALNRNFDGVYKDDTMEIMKIVISTITDEFENNELIVDVSGKYREKLPRDFFESDSEFENQEKTSIAIDFSSLIDLLNIPVELEFDRSVHNDFDAVASFLLEIYFYGIEDECREAEYKHLSDLLDETSESLSLLDSIIEDDSLTMTDFKELFDNNFIFNPTILEGGKSDKKEKESNTEDDSDT